MFSRSDIVPMSRITFVLAALLLISSSASAQELVTGQSSVAAQSNDEAPAPVTMIRASAAESSRFAALGVTAVENVPADVIGPFDTGMTSSDVDSLFTDRAPSVEDPVTNAPVALVSMSDSPFLLLLPGPVLLDQTGDSNDLAEKVLAFREGHPAITSGIHERLGSDPYTFYRGKKVSRDNTDEVVVSLGVSGKVRLLVSKAFPDDTVVREVLSGQITIVSYGQISLDAGDRGMLLVEVVQ